MDNKILVLEWSIGHLLITYLLENAVAHQWEIIVADYALQLAGRK